MAIIPSTQKFHTVSAEVDTENRGSETANSRREAFTMQDIVDTSGAGIPSLFEEGSFPGSGQETSTQRVGSSNEATKVYAIVSGGDSNTAAGSYATVSGGQGNIASNTSSPGGSTVGGGVSNIASGLTSTVAGGNNNDATGSRSVVAGGTGNIASGSTSAVVGGNTNSATGVGAFIGGGTQNDADSAYSTIIGGDNNNTLLTFDNSHLIGSNLTSDRADCTFVENLSIKSIPTSATGLPSGSIWSNAGVLNIVP